MNEDSNTPKEDSSTGLVVLEKTKSVSKLPTDIETQPEEPLMDIEKAREILRTLERTQEKTFTSPSEKIGHYDTTQIRQAMKAFHNYLLTEHPENTFDNSYAKKYGHLKKTGDWGELILGTLGPPQENQPKKRVMLLSLYPHQNHKPSITFDFPLIDKWMAEFDDKREGMEVHASTGSGKQKDIPSEFQSLIRGLRWMSANMLRWDEQRIVLPEDLDMPQLSLAKTQPLLKSS